MIYKYEMFQSLKKKREGERGGWGEKGKRVAKFVFLNKIVK